MVHVEGRAQGGQKVASGGEGETACWVGSSSPRILLETAAVLGICEELGRPCVMGKAGGGRRGGDRRV